MFIHCVEVETVTELYLFVLLFKGQLHVKRLPGFTELASAFQRAEVFFGNARKNNLEVPVLLIILKEFKEFVEQNLLT